METFVDLVETGDILELQPEDLVPVDATVMEGSSSVDESLLSGESRPITKSPGDTVLAGTQNRSATIRVRAVAIGNDTRLAKIVDLVESAAMEKPQLVLWANRIGGYFVVAVIVLAIATFFATLSLGTSTAVERMVALLIVACPCALALATPLAISVGMGVLPVKKS